MGSEATVLRGSKPLITAGAMLAGLMAFLDISIVNVALNDIRANFGTPLDQIAWVSTAYAMANITVIPMSGWAYGVRVSRRSGELLRPDEFHQHRR